MLKINVHHFVAARILSQISGYALSRGPQEVDKIFADRAVDICEDVAPESAALAAALNNQARFQKEFGDLEVALQTYQRVKDFWSGLPDFGVTHPNYGSTLNNIAGIYRELRDYARAVELMEQALSITEDSLGQNHTDTARRYRNLGALYGEWAYFFPDMIEEHDLRTREAEAEDTALERSLHALGPWHQETALGFNNAATRWLDNEPKTAIDYMQRAASVFVGIYGPDHAWTCEAVRDCFAFCAKNGLTSDETYKALMQTYENLVHEQNAWGVAKLNSLISAHDIPGEINEETISALAAALSKKQERMRRDGAPVEAVQWVMQEASYAASALALELNPVDFDARLRAAIARVNAIAAST